MKRNPIAHAAGLLACLALAAGVAGCRIHVDKDKNGEEKNVQVDTPFGGLHVNTDQTTAADLGLPVYPGAQIAPDNDNDKSADVHMGFGEWEMRVKVVNYSVADSEDKVTAFYKKALDRYGDVISCQDGNPVGTPKTTREGLACDQKNEVNIEVDNHGASGGNGHEKGFQLKAGSVRHQHIVAFGSSAPGETRFTLMAIDLPTGGSDDKGKSN